MDTGCLEAKLGEEPLVLAAVVSVEPKQTSDSGQRLHSNWLKRSVQTGACSTHLSSKSFLIAFLASSR
jgi:hypothetical protein